MKSGNSRKVTVTIAAIVLIALLAVVGALLFFPPSPRILVEPADFNFGFVKKGEGVVSHEFEVKNTGNANLEITAVSTSCGCTTAELGKNLLKPGESTTLTVSFDPNFHNEPEGSFERIVYLKSNDLENKEVEVTVFIEGVK